ncbi:hypothetical protein ACHQM5_001826 [Ranunculus cassubicifolius]
MLVEDCRKRTISEEDDGRVIAGKRSKTPPVIVDYSDDEDDFDVNEELPIREETIAEVMKWLEKELIACPNTTTIMSMSDSTSCGPFFSDQSSTVMCGFSHISYPKQHANFILSQSVFNYNFYPSHPLNSDEKQYYYDWEESKLFGNGNGNDLESEEQQKEQVSGESTSDESNGSDDLEQCDDNWLEMILTGDGCPFDLVD